MTKHLDKKFASVLRTIATVCTHLAEWRDPQPPAVDVNRWRFAADRTSANTGELHLTFHETG